MRLAVVRGFNPNVAEMFSYAPLRNFGVEPVLLAETSAEYAASFPSDLGMRLVRYKGLNTLLRRTTGPLHEYTRFLVEQKFGVISPLCRPSEALGYDVYNVSDLTPYHARQLAALVRRQPSKRLTITLWETIPRRDRRGLITRWVAPEGIPNVSQFIAVSQTAAAAAILDGVDPERVFVIQPAVDAKRFRPRDKDLSLLARWELSQEDFVVLFSGRLQRSKGLDTLLWAMANLAGRNDNPYRRIVLLVVGNGRDRGRYLRLARDLRIEDRVCFAGPVAFDLLPCVYSVADVQVLPSTVMPWWQEQLGFVLLEAMACGLPVVATHSGAIPEVLDGCGLLVSPGNFRELSDAILDLVTDETLRARLGQRARRLVSDRNDPMRVAQLLRNVLDRGNGR